MKATTKAPEELRQPLRLLLVEDDQDDAALLAHHLESAGYALHCERVANANDYAVALELSWDIILCDYSLPAFSPAGALEMLRERELETPLLVISGQLSQAQAADLMFQGARDFIDKNDLSRLLPAIERELQVCRLRREKRCIEERISRITYFDEGSALPNGNHFSETLEGLQQSEAGNTLIVAHLNVPRLGMITDTYGEKTGIEITRALAERLSAISYKACIARLGHNDFAVMMPCEGDCDSCSEAAAQIQHQFATPFLIEQRELYLSPTIGLSCYPCHGRSPANLLRNARFAMQHAHETEQPYQHFTAAIEEEKKTRTVMSDRLRGAVMRNDFQLVYQPKIFTRGRDISALEVLLRWHDEQLGSVSPGRFIPVAEATGDIVAIGEWVLQQAVQQAALWRQQGVYKGRIAVNLAMRQLRDPHFAEVVAEILQQSGFPATLLELEITETDIMKDSELSIQTLQRLKQLGVSLVIDDFGTGYSSLSYLKRLPISSLKIDRSFITDIEESTDSLSIVRAILALARSLRLDVVAEGVETARQMMMLYREGCDELQGYHISPPLDSHGIERFIAGYTTRMQLGGSGQ
jgi:diguanylate cyclase (GGDEF)-like protein